MDLLIFGTFLLVLVLPSYILWHFKARHMNGYLASLAFILFGVLIFYFILVAPVYVESTDSNDPWSPLPSYAMLSMPLAPIFCGVALFLKISLKLVVQRVKHIRD